jgi:hypothetical protein
MTHRWNIWVVVALLLISSGVATAAIKEKQLDSTFTAEIMKRDGSVAMTGALDMGGYKVTNSADGTLSGDLVTKSQLDAVSAGLQVKESVQATTHDAILDDNTDISGSPSYDSDGGTSTNGQITATLVSSGDFTVDGYDTSNGDRVLVAGEGEGTAEAMSVDTVADSSGSLNNTYFIFYTNASTAYYVWYNVASGGTDPTPSPPAGVSYTGIEVAISTDATANAVASATETAIDGAGIEATCSTPTTNDLTITNQYGGNVTDIADTGSTGFTIATDTQGTGLCPDANGIYVVTISGTSLTLDRATDADSDADLVSGTSVFVEFGTDHASFQMVLASPNPVICGGDGGTSQVWTYFQNLNLGDTAEITTINAGDVDAGGSSGNAARADHEHGVATAAAGTIQPDASAAEGSSTSLARADHTHAIVAAAPQNSLQPDGSNSEGSATSFARSDHLHAIAADTPGSIQPDDSAAEGTSTSFARADHTHAITADVAGTISPDDTASEGTATSFARSDHRHAIAADVAVSVGTANAEGDSSSFARANHVHDSTVATTSNKEMNPSNTSGDDADSGLTITATPGNDSYVMVTVNGVQYSVGDGVDTECSYFAASGAPTTPKNISAIAANDIFVWNGTTCGFDLATTDEVSFMYESF